MRMLPPLSSPSLTRERLAALLYSEAVTDPYPHLLRWLIWFPLLSADELTRLEQSRLAQQGQTRSPQKIAALLKALEAFQLIAHLVVNEPGWPVHQHRYFLTDLGLYVFAAQADPPLSVARVAQAYAVERADLISRVARIDIHLALATFSTSLVVEGNTYGYPVTSFQQPWVQSDTLFERKQTLRLDAAFLLACPQGTEQAFYVRADTNEQRPFENKRERIPLLRLLRLRHALHLQQETMPHLLLLTTPSHLAGWGMLLETISQQQGTALLEGAITTLNRIRRAGIFGPIWWTFPELTQGLSRGTLAGLAAPTTPFSHLFGAAVSPPLAERFSQRRTFAHLLTEHDNRSPHRPLPTYVGKPLTHEIATLRGTSLADALSGTLSEQREATALLNLALSTTQKEVLFWLTHQPLLTAHHLATLHFPEGHDRRGMQKQMIGLSSLHLLLPFAWYGLRPWHERERYLLTESALRYSALREGRPATHYLLPEEQKKRYKVHTFTIQQGTGGLFWQMEHTHGLYTCMAHLIAAAPHENMRVITWKNAREAIRTYRDPITQFAIQVRPDAELIYQINDQIVPHSILVEYDRATTQVRDCTAKYQTYADYLEYTRLSLPPVLVITQHEQAATRIRTCINRIAPRLPVVIVLEDQVRHPGLLTMLTQIDSP